MEVVWFIFAFLICVLLRAVVNEMRHAKNLLEDIRNLLSEEKDFVEEKLNGESIDNKFGTSIQISNPRMEGDGWGYNKSPIGPGL